MAKSTAFNCYTMIVYGARMLANIATIVNGMTGAELAPIAQTFMVAMFLNPLILNSLMYDAFLDIYKGLTKVIQY